VRRWCVKWPGRLDLRVSGSRDITEYMTFKASEYALHDLQDGDLWETFKEDFKGFSAETFGQCDTAVIRKLRRTLRQRSV
jgi:hypothetical protein